MESDKDALSSTLPGMDMGQCPGWLYGQCYYLRQNDRQACYKGEIDDITGCEEDLKRQCGDVQ